MGGRSGRSGLGRPSGGSGSEGEDGEQGPYAEYGDRDSEAAAAEHAGQQLGAAREAGGETAAPPAAHALLKQ
jgi:hypothetical protein